MMLAIGPLQPKIAMIGGENDRTGMHGNCPSIGTLGMERIFG